MFCVIQVPRAIVNLVELLNIVPLRDLHSDKTLRCPTWLVRSVISGCLKQNWSSRHLTVLMFVFQFNLPLHTEA